ncbi:MAG: hypothetical protein SF066_17560 [Thermoanaerobaculia bacterium]|nr:hypothetical protein [Thermoanaerobaculia bacterium]
MSLLLDLSPGLGFVLIASGIARIFRSYFDTIPLRVFAFCLVLILLRFGPELFAGRNPLPLQLIADTWPYAGSVRTDGRGNSVQADLLFEVAPLRDLVAEEIRGGRWPLWNCRFGTGMPLLGNPQAQVLEPTALVSVLWDAPRNVGLTASLRLFLVFVFVFAVGRRLGLGILASTFGAVAYSFGGYLSLWLGWPLAAVAVWTPGVLYGLLLTIDRGHLSDIVLASFCGGALLASGHPETILYSALGCAAFGFCRLALAKSRKLPLCRLALVGGLAFALASPALLTSIELLPQTFRHELLSRRNQRLEMGHAPRVVSRSLRESATLTARQVIPVISAKALGSDRTGTFVGASIGDRPGSGFPGTVAIVLAACGWFASGRRRPLEAYFLAIALVALALVAKPPGLPPGFAEIPILSSLPNQWSRAVLWFNLGIAMTAAFSFDRWWRGDRFGLSKGAGAAALALLFGSLAFVGPGLGLDGRWLTVQALLVALTAVFLASSPSSTKGGALLTLATLELVLLFGGDFSRMPTGQHLPTPGLLAELNQRAVHEAPFRIAALGEVLPPNLASLAGLNDLRVSDPARPWAPHQILRPVIADLRRVGDRFERADAPVLQSLGVRYWIVPPGKRLRAPWKRVYRSREGSIYEHLDALPIVFILPLEDISEGEEADLSSIEPGRIQDAATLGLASDHWALSASSSEATAILTSIYDDGNWHVLLDGVAGARVKIHGSFVGAKVPPGVRRLNLLYRPPAFVLGVAFIASALAVLAAVLCRPRALPL